MEEKLLEAMFLERASREGFAKTLKEELKEDKKIEKEVIKETKKEHKKNWKQMYTRQIIEKNIGYVKWIIMMKKFDEEKAEVTPLLIELLKDAITSLEELINE